MVLAATFATSGYSNSTKANPLLPPERSERANRIRVTFPNCLKYCRICSSKNPCGKCLMNTTPRSGRAFGLGFSLLNFLVSWKKMESRKQLGSPLDKFFSTLELPVQRQLFSVAAILWKTSLGRA